VAFILLFMCIVEQSAEAESSQVESCPW